MSSTYDRLAPVYDLLAAPFEWPLAQEALQRLGAAPGERVLEVGHGTGRALEALALAVGAQGRVLGVDLSAGMHRVAAARLRDAGLLDRVELLRGSALEVLPRPAAFDAAFSAFTVETFSPGAAAELLEKVKGSLVPGGRLALVAMAKGGRGLMASLYAWSHRAFPGLVDCAPIDPSALLRQAGFNEVQVEVRAVAGIPAAVALARA